MFVANYFDIGSPPLTPVPTFDPALWMLAFLRGLGADGDEIVVGLSRRRDRPDGISGLQWFDRATGEFGRFVDLSDWVREIFVLEKIA